MNLILSLLRFLVDFLVPKIRTEDVALRRVRPGCNLDSYDFVCSLEDVEPGEVFDAIVTVRGFSWMNLGVTYRAWNLRPFRRGQQ